MKARYVIGTFCSLLISCSLPMDPGALPIVVTGDSLTLEWNPPAYGFPGILSVTSYDVYYKKHGAVAWTLLESEPANEGPEVTIARSRLGAGSFDFAVDAVNSIGEQSTLHSSLDSNAYPPGGWYVVWD